MKVFTEAEVQQTVRLAGECPEGAFALARLLDVVADAADWRRRDHLLTGLIACAEIAQRGHPHPEARAAAARLVSGAKHDRLADEENALREYYAAERGNS